MAEILKESPKGDAAKREEEVLAFWKEQKIFEQSLEKPAPKGDYVFYDGPPFATGLPHTGSLLASVIKDVIPRFKTMQGYHVPRVWGWDCHGLPIENLVEKKLGLKSKKDILSVGIDTFNETARSLVLQYVVDWEKYVDRIGRWVDFKNSYKTMDNSYIESVWWALKELNKKNLLYEGRRVLMYCTHCETPLAKAEIAADNTYKDITEEAVTIEFKLKGDEQTRVLAWTTTPWTLPGNVALAVNLETTYVTLEKKDEGVGPLVRFILAKERIEAVFGDSEFSIVKEQKGKELVGLEYEPLYDIPALRSKNSYKIYAADFVTTDEGTGVVHTAVMYGEDDYVLGLKEKLPLVQMLNPNGTYNDEAPELVRGEYIKKAEEKIKTDLSARGLLFEKKMHTHSYPHCWRCGTPLIYNAVPSWFVNIQKIKARMLAENERITWVPGHLKHGRFQKIVESAPDWTISRNRFWASPLPIWKEKGGKGLIVVGSLDELLTKTKKSGNRYFVMRHGEALSNLHNVVDCGADIENHLTPVGKAGVAHTGAQLKREHIDLIIMSPVLRTRETAALVQKELGLPDSAVMVDERLHELRFGVYEGKSLEAWACSATFRERFGQGVEGGESYTDVRRRVGDFLFEMERRYAGKRILLVTHDCPAWLLASVAEHKTAEEIITEDDGTPYLTPGDYTEISFVPFPHNKNFELDLHRPYIDSIVLTDARGNTYERIPEVVDCWVESGAMPFASVGYPRDISRVNPGRFFGLFPKRYPADFIAEYIGQTRTWFYYLHAVGVALFNKTSFRAVAVTGNILAADGSKMSKSKGNYTDPMELMNRFGADALRLALMGSVVMAGEDFNFRDEEVREASRPLGVLWNSCQFFALYRDKWDASVDAEKSPHILDRWMLARLERLVRDVTVALEHFDTPGACRALREGIDDYSTWYVRRSRERVRGTDAADMRFTLALQRRVLLDFAKLLAPITPFLAESIYRELRGGEASVHLESWPMTLPESKGEQKLLDDMVLVRTAVSLALQAREKAGIKIRQPLGLLSVHPSIFPAGEHSSAYLEIVGEEINVKKVELSDTVDVTTLVALDTTLTPELKEEGLVRDFVRRIQAWRKDEGLVIADRPAYELVVSKEEESIAKQNSDAIMAAAGLSALTVTLRKDA